ncbi:hypothetical protein [Planktothrix agardhii]|uniref:hypothetical protein n=1 Tax=Planktothrix agardhii TaxID=1160 RepID=UPI001F270298|nr:hypothetical protein [Planktothrix agardhii]MCF3646012.1 hypothetical protein [Planktothrix agardhii 1026]
MKQSLFPLVSGFRPVDSPFVTLFQQNCHFLATFFLSRWYDQSCSTDRSTFGHRTESFAKRYPCCGDVFRQRRGLQSATNQETGFFPKAHGRKINFR